jgi:hypothetical protein
MISFFKAAVKAVSLRKLKKAREGRHSHCPTMKPAAPILLAPPVVRDPSPICWADQVATDNTLKDREEDPFDDILEGIGYTLPSSDSESFMIPALPSGGKSSNTIASLCVT